MGPHSIAAVAARGSHAGISAELLKVLPSSVPQLLAQQGAAAEVPFGPRDVPQVDEVLVRAERVSNMC